MRKVTDAEEVITQYWDFRERSLKAEDDGEKLRITCTKWNTEGEACGETNCTLKHQCNKVLRQGFLCWANHRAYEHQ